MKNIFWPIFDFIFLLFVFCIPFGVAFNITPDIDLASARVFIIVLFLVWISGVAFRKGRKIVFDLRAIGLLAILIIGALSLVSAQEIGWGLRKLAVFLSIFPLYFMIASFLKSGLKQKEKLLKVIFAGAAVSSVLGAIQFLSQFFIGQAALFSLYAKIIGPLFWGQNLSQMVAQNPSWLVEVSGRALTRAFGLFPDPHMMAFFLGLISPIILAFSLYKKKPVLFGLFSVMFIVLMLTFSRGGYLGAVFSVLAVIFLAWKDFSRKHKRLILSAAVLGLFMLIIFAGPVVSRFVSSFLLDEGSSLGRISIWKGSWNIFLSNPLLGVGLGNYPRAVEPLAIYRSPITSHNLYLDIMSETGIFGLAAWSFLIFGSMWQLLKSPPTPPKGGGHSLPLELAPYLIRGRAGEDLTLLQLRIGIFGSLVYFSVHSIFETAIFNPAILAMLMIILALVNVANDNLTHPPPDTLRLSLRAGSPLFKKEREPSV